MNEGCLALKGEAVYSSGPLKAERRRGSLRALFSCPRLSNMIGFIVSCEHMVMPNVSYASSHCSVLRVQVDRVGSRHINIYLVWVIHLYCTVFIPNEEDDRYMADWYRRWGTL